VVELRAWPSDSSLVHKPADDRLFSVRQPKVSPTLLDSIPTVTFKRSTIKAH